MTSESSCTSDAPASISVSVPDAPAPIRIRVPEIYERNDVDFNEFFASCNAVEFAEKFDFDLFSHNERMGRIYKMYDFIMAWPPCMVRAWAKRVVGISDSDIDLMGDSISGKELRAIELSDLYATLLGIGVSTAANDAIYGCVCEGRWAPRLRDFGTESDTDSDCESVYPPDYSFQLAPPEVIAWTPEQVRQWAIGAKLDDADANIIGKMNGETVMNLLAAPPGRPNPFLQKMQGLGMTYRGCHCILHAYMTQNFNL